MENVDSFIVERDGKTITLILLNIVEEGEAYVFNLRDAKRIRDALTIALGGE